MPQGKGTYGTKVGRPAKKKVGSTQQQRMQPSAPPSKAKPAKKRTYSNNVGSTSISPAGYLKAATAKKKRAAPKVKKGGGGR